MSFFKKLFGGGEAADGGAGRAPGTLGEEEYKGFLIKAIEMRAGSEYQLAGTIEKDVGGEHKTHQFVRADRISSKDDLVPLALAKGRQIIDEQGEGLFGFAAPHKLN
mgnify:CR=1 FL=1